MELKDWADPPCFTKVYEGGCMKGENFMLFEYTPETSQFVTMLKMSGLIPRVRKNPNGAVIAVDQWSVSIDVVQGTAADLVTAMGLPAAGCNTIGPLGVRDSPSLRPPPLPSPSFSLSLSSISTSIGV